MNESNSNPEARVALFQSREIRRTLHNDEWWFVITDIVAALTDAADPSARKAECNISKFWRGWLIKQPRGVFGKYNRFIHAAVFKGLSQVGSASGVVIKSGNA